MTWLAHRTRGLLYATIIFTGLLLVGEPLTGAIAAFVVYCTYVGWADAEPQNRRRLSPQPPPAPQGQRRLYAVPDAPATAPRRRRTWLVPVLIIAILAGLKVPARVWAAPAHARGAVSREITITQNKPVTLRLGMLPALSDGHCKIYIDGRQARQKPGTGLSVWATESGVAVRAFAVRKRAPMTFNVVSFEGRHRVTLKVDWTPPSKREIEDSA